jgi:hypothetical protein
MTLDPLSNLEVVRYGNLLEVEWEGTSINDVRARIEAEGLTPAKVRDELRGAEGSHE